MTPTALWISIAATLRDEIAAGRYRPGDKLPTEADLARRFGVNRHTVRRALADLAEARLVHARRGSGVYVAARPTDYPLGRRVRFHQNLAAAGRSADRKVLLRTTGKADRREAEALALPEGAAVHVYEGISLADGQPLALFRSVFPADRLPGLLDALAEDPSVTRALARAGVADYTRASTRLTAKRATPTQALHLDLRPGDPILRSVSVNVDAGGQPVEYGRTWFAGDRVSLIVAPD
ncbi:phosphonate metabolism transcriptional regulator PhnF [Rhodovulum sulfidophilum]|uniref:GntR family phosphonate transport system transcriptional regulator n=2 Tax=Rhodovulum visakhapatnamense TaxID=364297 RepID=A0A4R8FPV6_9RHOB|nr:phosphonate metabolism transcriptional regulator PhnF [Rhodovulum visakhapatnamense]MBL3569711.1 phosphonate metabolism transcriptional regulator PhnF [Rhodovulum visakhapatnamense]OLS44581.1 phosphonate metabolism transcriptional regulator PhnF [Rhodovulum sulfidophilum]TDX28507.1 GntR family phosphonate transport system transcriptional regulator [Rhodovulum visakhapatnamense]